jgi:hemolysin activation/secretion protein
VFRLLARWRFISWRSIPLASLSIALLLSNPRITFGADTQAASAGPAKSAPAPAGSPSAPAAPAPAPKFDIHEFRVLGNTVLPSRDIEASVYPFLGDGKTLADVEAARAALQNLYNQRGYKSVFVDIPPQEVAEQIVRLRVVEGRLDKLRIAGAQYFSEREVLAQLPSLKVGEVPNFPALQQQLAAVNAQTTDRSVVPVLKAGGSPGTMDISLKVDDHLPLHGSLELDNQYTASTKPLRATAALNYSNLFGELDNLALQYQDSPQKIGEVALYTLAYTFHPLPGGLQPSLQYVNSSTDVATIGGIGVLGKGEIASAHFSYPIEFLPTAIQNFSFGVDYKHFRDLISLDANNSLRTPISYVNLSLAYFGTWRTDPIQTIFSTSANFGPRGVANDPAAFENKRYLGRSNYFYLRADASLIAHLPAGFQSLVRLAGQYSPDPLISNESYSITGIDGVRGYLEAEELGDQALKGTLQLQSPQWHWGTWSLADALVFFDAGRTYVIAALGQPTHVELRSWGAGINLLPGQHVTGSVIWAHALRDGSQTKSGENRVLFTVRSTF